MNENYENIDTNKYVFFDLYIKIIRNVYLN